PLAGSQRGIERPVGCKDGEKGDIPGRSSRAHAPACCAACQPSALRAVAEFRTGLETWSSLDAYQLLVIGGGCSSGALGFSLLSFSPVVACVPVGPPGRLPLSG